MASPGCRHGKARYHCAMRTTFLSSAAILFAVLAALTALPAKALVGMVLTVEGQVNVISGKQECGLRYGLDLDEGDTVRTGEKSWAVLSLLDGAKITVRPSTEVRIEVYRFADIKDAPRNYATLALTRGSLRIITGAIAKGLNTGYRVRTPEATLEMHGTDHDITHVVSQFTPVGDAAPGTYGKTYAGEAVIRNSSGDLTLRDGQAAFVALRVRSAPRSLTTEPWFFSMYSAIDRRAAAVADALSGPNLQ
jgi:hypothetical protein